MQAQSTYSLDCGGTTTTNSSNNKTGGNKGGGKGADGNPNTGGEPGSVTGANSGLGQASHSGQSAISETGPDDQIIGGKPAGNGAGATASGAEGGRLPGALGGGQSGNGTAGAGDAPAVMPPGPEGSIFSPSLRSVSTTRSIASGPGFTSSLRPAQQPVEAGVVAGFGMDRVKAMLLRHPDAPSASANAAALGSSDAGLSGLSGARPALAAPGLLMDMAEIANDLRRAKKLRQALQAAEEAGRWLALNPDNVEALLLRAEALIKARRYDQAEKDALRAAQLDPNNGRAWKALALARLHLGKYGGALEAAQKAVALKGDAFSYALRAGALDALGRRAEALAELEQAAQLDPRYKEKLDAARLGGSILSLILNTGEDSALEDDGAGSQSSGLPIWLLLVGGLAVVFFGTMFLTLRSGGKALFSNPPAAAEAAAAAASVAGHARVDLKDALGGKYELKGVIGRGGMGLVYEALDRSLGRRVAIKRMSEAVTALGPDGRALFLREARTVAALHHPAIVDIYEIIEQGAELYLVFEFVGGRTAAQILAERGKLPLQAARKILKPVCEALELAHSQGLVHRDLKPANIMVTDQGFVKLMDFGIARSLSDAAPVAVAPTPSSPERAGRAALVARTTNISGTPWYMAPEAAAGIVRKESDVYSLGVCLYEMLSGRIPLRDGLQPALFDPSVWSPLSRALEQDPDKRIASAREFYALLPRQPAA